MQGVPLEYRFNEAPAFHGGKFHAITAVAAD